MPMQTPDITTTEPTDRKKCFPRLSAAFFFLLAGLLFLIASSAFGQDRKSENKTPDLTELSIEELMNIEIADVSGASKFEQKTTEAPSSVSIVTAVDIKRYGYRTLAEILQSVRGFYTSNDRTYSYAGVRGFSRAGDYNTRLLLLIDGHRINDDVYDQAFLGTEFPLDVDLIDSVEIIRGPTHSLYGSNAFMGVINVITRNAEDFNGFEVSGEAGSYRTFKERLSYGREFSNGSRMVLSGSNLSSNGQNLYFKEFDAPATHDGWADSCDSTKNGSIFTSFKHKGFALQGVFASREKDIPTAPYGTVFNDDRTKIKDVRAYLDLSYSKSLNETTTMKAKAFYDHYQYKADWSFDDPLPVINKDDAKGKWWGGELEFVKKFFDTHTAVIGAAYTDYFLIKQRNYDNDPYVSYLDENRSNYNWGTYIQDQFPILDNKILISAGLRYDHYSTFGGTTNVRTSLIYKPTRQTALKLNYGKGFRAPNSYELYYSDGDTTTKANPDLKPEKIDSYELVLEQYWKNYRFSLSGYYYSISDVISLHTDSVDGLLVFKNMDDIESKGAEFEVEGKWTGGIEGKISYSLQESEDKKTGATQPNSPKHLVKSNLYVPIIGQKLSAGLEVQYTSSCKSYQGNRVEDFVVVNLTLLSRNLWNNLEISGTVYNLFDSGYETPASIEHRQDAIPQDSRNFRIKLTYKF
ncbi:MAG: Vitamin B12 transporter BtuB precursor [Syntrophus sp. PtaB.Bin001]|nr:MAG: Vitamin B12 transporter BtuB precursor [Syntrophus sp. PtaB.Bin001]